MPHFNFPHSGRHLLLASALLLSGFAWPHASLAQKAGTEVAYFAVQAGPLATALQRLQREAGVNIVYEAGDLRESRVEATEFRGAKVSEILRQLLGQSLRFEEKQGVIILQPTTPAAPAAPAKPARRAAREVRGKVTEAGTGKGLPGVTIVVKGTSVGTATNALLFYGQPLRAASVTLQYRHGVHAPRHAG